MLPNLVPKWLLEACSLPCPSINAGLSVISLFLKFRGSDFFFFLYHAFLGQSGEVCGPLPRVIFFNYKIISIRLMSVRKPFCRNNILPVDPIVYIFVALLRTFLAKKCPQTCPSDYWNPSHVSKSIQSPAPLCNFTLTPHPTVLTTVFAVS